jgi:hypothetical protein
MTLPPTRPLLRLSQHDSGEPFFGRSGNNRFDAPNRSYGTCYCGFTLACAYAETVLHEKSVKAGGGFDVLESELDKRWVVVLANMHGADLLKTGADGRLSCGKAHCAACPVQEFPEASRAARRAHKARREGLLIPVD